MDNCSKADDFSNLLKLKSQVHDLEVVRNVENNGYFSGLNFGLEYLKGDGKKYDFQVICNNDLEFDKNFVSNLFKLDFPNNNQVICPEVVTSDGVYQNPLRVNRLTRRELLIQDIYHSNYYISRFFSGIFRFFSSMGFIKKTPKIKPITEPLKIYSGIGACYILHSGFFKSNKKLDDSVFMWGEEALLSNQVYSSGGNIYLYPSLKVKHAESASVKSITSREKYEIVRRSYKVYRDFL